MTVVLKNHDGHGWFIEVSTGYYCLVIRWFVSNTKLQMPLEKIVNWLHTFLFVYIFY